MNKIAKQIEPPLFYLAAGFLSIDVAQKMGFSDYIRTGIFSVSLYIIIVGFYLKGRDSKYTVKIKEKDD
jgi:hypothetical protein